MSTRLKSASRISCATSPSWKLAGQKINQSVSNRFLFVSRIVNSTVAKTGVFLSHQISRATDINVFSHAISISRCHGLVRNKHSRTNESRLLKTFSRVQTPVILSVCFASCTSRTAHSSLHICLQLVARQFQRALIHSPFLSFFFQSCSGCTIQTETAFLTQT